MYTYMYMYVHVCTCMYTYMYVHVCIRTCQGWRKQLDFGMAVAPENEAYIRNILALLAQPLFHVQTRVSARYPRARRACLLIMCAEQLRHPVRRSTLTRRCVRGAA